MSKWLIVLCILSANVQASDVVVKFSSGPKLIEIKKSGDRGHGVFEDGKFVKYYPTLSRDEVFQFISEVRKYDVDSIKRTEITKALNDNFDKTLKSASDKELLETSFALASLAEEALSEKEVECNDQNGLKTVNNEVKTKEEAIYCECEIPQEMKVGLKEDFRVPSFDGEYWNEHKILGQLESSSFQINTSNDNHLHGLYRQVAPPATDGNDRGRTFGLDLGYSLKGSDGEFRVGLESILFTELYETDNKKGFYVNEDGAYLQKALDRNRLDVSLRKNTDNKGYVIIGSELEQLTDGGIIASPMQKAWHSLSKKTVKYDNQEHMDDKINLTVYGGLGREWIKDIGKWKCTTKVEGTIGQSVLNLEDTYAKARGEVELSSNELLGRSSENPFVLVTMWAEGSVETKDGNEKGAGLNVTFPKKLGKWVVKPHVGFSIKDEKEDRYFTQEQSSKIEPESHFGISFTRKF